MSHKLALLIALAALLAACSGELPAVTPSAPEPVQPAPETQPAPEVPPTEETPIMVEPPEQRAPRPINSEYLPQPEDGNRSREEVFIDRSDLHIMESFPVQIALVLEGSLPTSCNQLRVVAKPPDEQNRLQISVYSVVDPAQTCLQALEPFEANIGLGSFPAGHYSVWVNGEMVGEFDS